MSSDVRSIGQSEESPGWGDSLLDLLVVKSRQSGLGFPLIGAVVDYCEREPHGSDQILVRKRL